MLVAQNSDLIIFVDSFQSGPPVFSDIQYSIIGDDENVLRAIGSELELIIKALERNKGRRKAAAKELGISERTLYRKIKQYDIKL